jgi:DsbC/DsbD-like thiol-disulfide interchange protein
MKYMSMPVRLTHRMRIAPILMMFALIASAHAPASAAPPANLVQAELLADVATIKPGQPFTLGVRFRIHEKWHIYWKYAGDSGLPTKINWHLPPGFEPGELQFPIPKRIELPGELVNYGYEDEVVLMTQVTPPRDLKSGATVDLLADASWLVCENACIPGKVSMKLSLLVDETAPPTNEELFKKWKALVPTKISQADKAGVVEFGAKPNDAGTVTARISWPKPPTNVQWFPAPPAGTGVEDAQAKTEGGQSSFTLKLVPPPKESKQMGFVVAYTDASGKRQGVEFTVDLPPAGK